MSIEEYLPYKMARELLPIGLFGPSPYNPHSCICGRYIVDDFCLCATACTTMPKYKWAKENPEAYKAEQDAHANWKKTWQMWHNQWQKIEQRIWTALQPHVDEFNMTRDAETEIGCWECEQNNKQYCTCDSCDCCGSKYCYKCGDDEFY